MSCWYGNRACVWSDVYVFTCSRVVVMMEYVHSMNAVRALRWGRGRGRGYEWVNWANRNGLRSPGFNSRQFVPSPEWLPLFRRLGSRLDSESIHVMHPSNKLGMSAWVIL